MFKLKLSIVMLICVTALASHAEAQMLRKGGNYLLKKLGWEVAEESAEKAGRQVVAKSTKTAGQLVTTRLLAKRRNKLRGSSSPTWQPA